MADKTPAAPPRRQAHPDPATRQADQDAQASANTEATPQPGPTEPLLDLAQASDGKLAQTLAELPDPAPVAADAPPAECSVVNLGELLFEIKPDWDDILRSRVLHTADQFNAILDKVKDAALTTCWPDLFTLARTGPDDAPYFVVQPVGADQRPTRLDVLDDAGPTAGLLDGKRAIVLFVDTVAGGSATFVQGKRKHTEPARKARAVVLGEGWQSFSLPQLPPRTTRVALLIRLLG